MNYNKLLEQAIDSLVLDLKSSTGLSEFVCSQEQYKKSLWNKVDEKITNDLFLLGAQLSLKVNTQKLTPKEAIDEYCKGYKALFMTEFHKEVQKRKFNWND